MKTAIEMAREAELDVYALGKHRGTFERRLEYFVAIAIAERNKQQVCNFCQRCGKRLAKDGIHTCSPPRSDAPDTEQQQPIAYGYIDDDGMCMDCLSQPYGVYRTPLYTTPPTAALAARQMRDAAVKVCIESLTDEVRDNGCEWIVDEIKNKIAALPVPGEEK